MQEHFLILNISILTNFEWIYFYEVLSMGSHYKSANNLAHMGVKPFLPEASFGLWVLLSPASVCVCVSLCVNHLLVRAITRDPFKLELPNLDQRCKRPWLRSLLFWGWLTLTFKVKFNLKVKIYPIFELVRAITLHPFGLGPPNLDQRCKIPWLRYLLFWGLIELDMSNLTYFQNPVYLHRFCSFDILVRPA